MGVVLTVLKSLGLIVPLLISVAYFTLAERKIISAIQRRRGPNVVGFQGLLQPLADGLKLFVKESIFPSNANKLLFVLAPIITFLLSLLGWAVIPLGEDLVISDINLGILYLFVISSLAFMVLFCQVEQVIRKCVFRSAKISSSDGFI